MRNFLIGLCHGNQDHVTKCTSEVCARAWEQSSYENSVMIRRFVHAGYTITVILLTKVVAINQN